MADTDECDVLVVGLGPAGAAAAAAAAKAGARVIAIECRQSPGRAADCPEFIPIPIGLHAQVDHLVIQSIVGTRSHLADGGRADALLPGCVLNRDAFDRALVGFSSAAGAQLQYDVMLVGLDADHSEAVLGRGGRTRRVLYRAMVAADGHASAVARQLGLPPLKKMHTLRYRVALHAPQDAVDVWVSPRYPGGYGWLIPAGREAVIGTGMENTQASEALDALHQQLAGAGLVGSDVLGRSAGAVPVEGLRQKLAMGNILFAGDAAGMAHPLTGAGIYSAVISGEAAGGAAAEWSRGHLGSLAAYEARMRGQFSDMLTRAAKRREPLISPFEEMKIAPRLGERGWSLVRDIFEQ